MRVNDSGAALLPSMLTLMQCLLTPVVEHSCKCRQCITYLLSYSILKCVLHSPHYATRHKLPISHGLSDNSWAFQNFMKNVLNIKADSCDSHCHQQWNT